MFSWIKKIWPFKPPIIEPEPQIFRSGAWFALRRGNGCYSLFHHPAHLGIMFDDPWVSKVLDYSNLNWNQVKYLHQVLSAGPKWSYLDGEQEKKLISLGKISFK